MTDSEQYSEIYAKRRTITKGEPTESVIHSVGRDEHNQRSITLRSAGEYYKLNVESGIESDYVLSKLIELKGDSNVGRQIELYFSEDMSKCGFSENNQKFDVDHLGESPDREFESDDYDVINQILIESEYEERSPLNNDGWRIDVSEVSGTDKESFRVIARTGNLVELEWDIDVPLTTEGDSDEVASLIENQGGGSPDMIDSGGRVNVVHKSDLPQNLDHITYDSNQQEWALIEPETFENWENEKGGHETGWLSEPTEVRIKGFMYVILPALMKFMWDSLSESYITEQVASTELFITVNEMYHFMFFSTFFVGISMIVYSMYLETR